MAESESVLNRLKKMFGENFENGVPMQKVDQEEFYKTERRLSRSKSGRMKSRPRRYSTMAEINFFPPTTVAEEPTVKTEQENVFRKEKFKKCTSLPETDPTTSVNKAENESSEL